MGVPVNPKNRASGKVFLIVRSMSPKVERWHSSMMNTMRLPLICSRSESVIPPSSERMRLIFWMEVTISMSLTELLLSRLRSSAVFSVPCTASSAAANARYSARLWVPSSMRSIRKTTLSAFLELAMSCALLKLVMVFPEPVVCQIYPPRMPGMPHCLRAFTLATRSEIARAA